MPSTKLTALTVVLSLLGAWLLSGYLVEEPGRPPDHVTPPGLAVIELIVPLEGEHLRDAFAWHSPVEADRYYVELLDEERRPFYRAESRGPSLDMSPTFFELLTPDERYWWRVYGVDDQGERVAVSVIRSFVWRG